MNTHTHSHWLVKAATDTGVIAPGKFQVAPGAATKFIWEEIERTSGLSETELVIRLAERLHLPVAELQPSPAALKVVPERIATQHSVLPLRETNQSLLVATADPMNFPAEQALGFASGRSISFALAAPRMLEQALRTAYSSGDEADDLIAGLDENLLNAVVAVADDTVEAASTRDVESQPVVKLTNLILSDAIRSRASDIHIQPVNAAGVVRCRVDGVMRNTMQLPLSALARVISRIKVLAHMNIADRVRPQDGRARLKIHGGEYDLRVSTIPVSGGEKAVIRILAPTASTTVADLGLPENELQRIQALLRQRDGVLAVTGPTGSGKTTTLYSALRQLATGETNIVTVEDPIEYRLAGVSQIQVDTKRGVTFASALRAVLRQDPDVILIGEMRDEETASIGVQAAMTGHLVLATLHTNDAAGTMTRMAELGVDRSTLADTLRGALAQRLLRRLCNNCAVPAGKLTDNEARLSALYGVKPVRVPQGCNECSSTGYRGRIPVVEVLVITPTIQELISHGASTVEIQRAAIQAGMRPLLAVALDHVRAGHTSLEEVDRVLGETNSAKSDSSGMAGDVLEDQATESEKQNPTVLLVDDDATVRQFAKFVLETEQYHVVEAGNGREALEYIAGGKPVSLVVLDLDMPEMNGGEVLQAVRANPATMALPIIVLTASERSEAQVMDWGADDYIRKPFEPQRFLARVKAVLRRAAM